MREVRSWVSVENCEIDVWELRDTLLAVGESTLGFGCGDGDGADESAVGVPRTRPPPNVLRDMITGTWEAGVETVFCPTSSWLHRVKRPGGTVESLNWVTMQWSLV